MFLPRKREMRDVRQRIALRQKGKQKPAAAKISAPLQNSRQGSSARLLEKRAGMAYHSSTSRIVVGQDFNPDMSPILSGLKS